MKTTVEVPDALMRDIRRYALERDMSFRQVVETSLRETLARPTPKGKFKLKDCSVGGKGMLNDYGWEEIRTLIYEGHGG